MEKRKVSVSSISQWSRDIKNHPLLALCNNYVLLHLWIAGGLVLLSSFLVPLTTELKRVSYQALDTDNAILSSLGVQNAHPSAREAAQILALILPHGVNNIKGSSAGLDKLLFNGVLVNLGASALHLFCAVILRVFDFRPSRLSISLHLGLELSFLVVLTSDLLFGATANLKLPFWPLSVWADLFFQQLAIHRVYPVTTSKYLNLDIASIADSSDVAGWDRFCSLDGLRLLNRLFEPSLPFRHFFMQCLRAALTNVRYGLVPLLSIGFGILFLDVLPLAFKLRMNFGLWPILLRANTPYKRVLAGPFIYILCCSLLAKVFLCNYPSCTMRDNIPDLPEEDQPTKPQYMLFTKSFMTRPGQPRTAVDVFLPPDVLWRSIQGLKERSPNHRVTPLGTEWCARADNLPESFADHYNGTREIPTDTTSGKTTTFISATRYNRRMGLRWPFTGMSVWGQERGAGSVAIWTWPLTRGLVKHQFPVVIIDARGTGASEGIRLIDLDEPEIEDFNAVAHWTKGQFWSNGILAGGGVSYDGLTALKLAARPNSPIDIVVAMYSPLHPVTDLLQNNGMACRTFVDDYSGLTEAFERRGNPLWHWIVSDASYIPFQIKLGFLFTFRLPSPPRGWEEGFGRESLGGRQDNWDMKRIADTTLFTDDSITLPGGRKVTAQEGGVNEDDFQRIIDRGIPTYWSAGQCDSTAVRRMEALYPRLNHMDSFHRLIVGPWGHGGRRGCGDDGTWACGDDDGFHDMAIFVKSAGDALRGEHGRRPVSSSLNYIEGEGWTAKSHGPNLRKAMVLSFGTRLKVAAQVKPPSLSAVNPKHLVFIPKGLIYDLRVHIRRRDWSGVGHDVSEISIVLGSRLNQILASSQTLVRAVGRYLFSYLRPRVQEDRAIRAEYERAGSVANVSWVHTSISSDFSTTGSLSRWSIVQHLMRMPLDTGHVIQCSRKLRHLIDWLQRLVDKQLPPSVLEFVTPPLARSAIIQGIPRVQVPFLLLEDDVRHLKSSHLDWAVVAVLQVNDTYLSEGRALSSMAGSSYIPIQNITHDLPAALRTGNPLSTHVDMAYMNMRADFRPISDLLAQPNVTGALVFLRFQLEALNSFIPAGSTFRLILLPEDYTNFPWKRTARKIEIYGANPSFGYAAVTQAQTWRVPVSAEVNRGLGWLMLPFATKQ